MVQGQARVHPSGMSTKRAGLELENPFRLGPMRVKLTCRNVDCRSCVGYRIRVAVMGVLRGSIGLNAVVAGKQYCSRSTTDPFGMNLHNLAAISINET